MSMTRVGWSLSFGVITLTLAGWLASGPVYSLQAPDPETAKLAGQAQAVLNRYCISCHTGPKAKAELDLTDVKLYLEKVIVPGSPDTSELLSRIRSTDDPMPPDGKPRPNQAEIDTIKDWITSLTEKKQVVQASTNMPVQPVIDLTLGPIAERATSILRARCSECHQQPRISGGVEIMNFERLQKQGKIVVANGKGDVEKSPLLYHMSVELAKEKKVKPMPPGSRPKMTPEELLIIQQWVQEGAKAANPNIAFVPGTVGSEYVMKAILDDVAKLRAQGVRDKIGQYRYFSLNHLLLAGVTEKALQENRDAFTLVLNHLTWSRDLVKPEAIEPTNTVFRVNIEDLGWDITPYQDNDKKIRTDINLHDLILLEYPYMREYPQSNIYRQLQQDYLVPGKLVRPIPYVHAEWFTSIAAQTPLYEDLLQLPFTLQGVENRVLGIGTTSKANVTSGKATRSGNRESGVSKNNRLIERHRGLMGYYWISHDFANSVGKSDFFKHPFDFEEAGGEMIWKLPNGMQGYYVCETNGTRLNEAPTEIVADEYAADKKVRNGMACIRCHEEGIKNYPDQVRKFLDAQGVNASTNAELLQTVYPGDKEMAVVSVGDGESFQRALVELLGVAPDSKEGRAPSPRALLQTTVNQHLDASVSVRKAGAELGMKSEQEAEQLLLNNSGLRRLGLNFNDQGGSIKRDNLEREHANIVEQLGIAKSAMPIDALTVNNFAVDGSPLVTLQTDTKRTKFVAGDEFAFIVKNESDQVVFVEIIGIGRKSAIGEVTKGVVKIQPKGQLRFPPDDKKKFRVRPGAGQDRVVLFASTQEFAKGERLVFPRAANEAQRDRDMGDRFIHDDFRKIQVKKLLVLETN